MMAGQHITILLTLVFVLAIAQVAHGSDKVWIQHNSRVGKFVCKVPQARSFRFDEMVEEKISIKAVDAAHESNAFNRMLETISDICPKDLLNNFSVYPTETVLHRCEHSGACSGTKGCLPTKMDEIKLLFAVTSLDLDPTIRYVEVVTTNHTTCACQNRKDKPKK